MKTLVVDTGMNLVGIFSVEENAYVAYRGDTIREAIQRIQAADEIVTYCGEFYDLGELGKFAGIVGDLPLNGVHTDMRSICWSDRIIGSSLLKTYEMCLGEPPTIPDSQEDDNRRDCYMTFKLWELWKAGTLRVIDGHYEGSQFPFRVANRASS
jgi:hypothetical protein